MDIRAAVLTGRHVRLVPLAPDDLEGLVRAASDGKLWELTVTGIPDPDHMAAWIENNLNEQKAGTQIAYTIRAQPSAAIVGTTSFLYIDAENRKLDIGRTWIAASWQRTPINTEAKWLMLRHAFEVWGCGRVQFITNVLNERSRASILRLGATEEGVMRNHMRRADGSYRDSVCYSIINSEWGEVKKLLARKLGRPFAWPPEHGR